MKSFARTVSGFCPEGITLALLVVIVGCASSSGSGTPGTPPSSSTAPLSPNGAKNIYVSQQSTSYGPGSILQFTATSNGSVSPNSTLTTQPKQPLPYGLATDSSGSIYVGAFSQTGPEVLIYPVGTSGTASPTRTILGGASFIDPLYMTVDSSDQLYVLDPTGSLGGSYANDGGVYVFASTANGTATPIRHLQGSLTQLATSGTPNAISVDAADNIYVSLAPTTTYASTWTILVFSATQNGNVAPARVITATSPTSLVDPLAYALDANGNLYVDYSDT